MVKDLFDVLLLPTPTNWFWWWVAFAPCLVVAFLIWATGGAYSGWLVAGVVAVFALISRQFAQSHWKVVMRSGAGLTVLALLVMFGAAVTVETPGTGAVGTWLYPMHQLGFIPLMLTGLGLCTVGGISALMRGADD